MMHPLQRSPLSSIHPFITPAGETHQHGIQTETLASKTIFIAQRAIVIGNLDQNALLDQLRETFRETVPGDAEITLKVFKPAGAEKGVP